MNSPKRPYSSAQAFEQGIQEASDKYAAAGYTVDEATIRKQRPAFTTVNPAEWTGEPPPHDWMVDGCFLRSTVSMLSGDGGLGKSLLMQQLCTAAAIGVPWLGLETVPCKTFSMFCEDDVDELQRRQYWINKHYQCGPSDLAGKVEYAARVGHENVLMEFDRRTDKPQRMPLFDDIERKVIASGAQIVVLDTLADVFAGNEIIRNQVRRFISALRALAMRIQGVVILTAHPSLAGLNNKSGISGSTAWNNSVRSRLYLTRANQPEEEDNNERLLKTMKNNHGPFGGRIRVKWEYGVFNRCDMSAAPLDQVEKIDLDGKILQALRDMIQSGTMVSASFQNRGCLSSLCRRWPGLERVRAGDVMSAQMRLLKQGRIVQVEIGPESKRRAYLRTPDMRLPGEPEGKPE